MSFYLKHLRYLVPVTLIMHKTEVRDMQLRNHDSNINRHVCIYNECMSLYINMGSTAVADAFSNSSVLHSTHIQFNNVDGNPFIVATLVVAKANFNVVVDGFIKGLEKPGHLGILTATLFDAKAGFSVP